MLVPVGVEDRRPLTKLGLERIGIKLRLLLTLAIQNGLDWAKSVPVYDGISDLIRKSRRLEDTYDPTEVLVDIALPSDWLFTWVSKLEPNPAKAYSALLFGFGSALKVQKDMLHN
jgi:hypothetical protein